MSYGACAVVGSGGTLRNAHHGREIDAHDAVIRFNLAPTGGEWLEAVGSRSTFRLFNGQSRSRHTLVRANTSHELLYCPFDKWLGKCILSAVSFRTSTTSTRVGVGASRPLPWLMVNPVLIWQAAQLQHAHGGRHVRMVSTGLLGVVLALAMCETVSLYGFGNQSAAAALATGVSASTCGHYWECSRNQSRYFGGKAGYHDWKAQWRVVQHFVDAGAVRFVGNSL
uniref:Uncharacterized protein n=1 Tax=Calcidiscus leptoporus TaxID=127549 RepID=A0A7S0NWS0_9EUKA|mmetsp:Transcript_30864/g.71710  ORF Transcript_30864/g.71710 Transcript_30864/m.71710 type:complete len:225 (+) Transcript_30864:503-1177(+)